MGLKNLSQLAGNLRSFVSEPERLKKLRSFARHNGVTVREVLKFNWIPRNLSYYVNLQKRKLLKLGRRKSFFSFMTRNAIKIQGFLTSKWSLFAVLLLLIMFFIFPIDALVYDSLSFPQWSYDYYLTLWQVYGAIVGLSFVALFFSYEAFFSRVSSTFKNLEFRFRQEFYRKTLVQPLLFFNLFSLVYVGIIINTSKPFQSITLLAISILSICFLFAKAVSFFESEEMEKTRSSILQSEIVDSIDAELDRRLSTNLLLKIENNERFKYEFLTMEPEEHKVISLKISERKRISDIAIDKIISKMESKRSKFYLKKGIGDIISPNYNVVATVPRQIDDKTIEALKKCFKLKSVPARKDLHLALDDITQQLSNAVNNRNSRELTRFLEIYYHTLEKFLKTLVSYGIRYSPEQAKQGDFIHEWEPIFQVQNDFFQLLESSVETGHKEIIRTEIYFIQDVLDLSNQNDDYLIFHRFKDFWVTIYCLALELEDKPNRDFTIELLLRVVTEYISTHLLLHLEHNEMDNAQLDKYREYSTSSLLKFEQMLKASIEKKSFESFSKINSTLDHILTNFDPENRRPYVVDIEVGLMVPNLSQEEKKLLNEKVKIATAKIQLKNDLNDLLLEIWLGIGGWITELFNKSKYNSEETSQFLKPVLTHFKDLQILASLYSRINTIYPEFSHSWKWWEMEDVPSGVVVGLSQEIWLTRFYCLAGITLTPREITPNQSLDPTLNAESNLNAVKSQCSDIIENSAKWSSVIGISPEELIAKANNFVTLHERSAGKQKKIESKKLIEQQLDEQKIAKFKEEVTKAWENSSEIRAVITKLGSYSEKPTVNEMVPLFGLQQWVPKSEFVKEPLTTVIGIEQFGQAIGRGENNTICSILMSNCSSRSVSENVMISNISEIINEMKAKNLHVNALFVGSLHIIREFRKTELFKPSRELKDSLYFNLKGYEGEFDGLPVFLVLELEKDVICLIDLKSIGNFNQYKVKENDTAILNFDFQFIDEKKASEFIKDSPKLKENEKGEILPDLEAISRLQEFVLVKITERFEFTSQNKEGCSFLRIKPNDLTPT